MASSNSMQLLQAVRFRGALEDKAGAGEAKDRAIAEQREGIDKTYQNRLKEVEENRQAREDASLGTLIGSIICPVVGTFIGSAIGGACGNDNKDAAAAAKTAAGVANIDREKASDVYQNAVDQSETAASDIQALEKFSRELRAEELRQNEF